MVGWIVAMYVLSAVLPLIGLSRLFWLARREARALDAAPKSKTPGAATVGQVDILLPRWVAATAARPRAVLLDFGFIGIGVVLATAASIASLFVE